MHGVTWKGAFNPKPRPVMLYALVLVRVMVWLVEVVPGTLLKTRAVGLIEKPRSGEPKPVRAEVMVP